jgi:hypothetical protein
MTTTMELANDGRRVWSGAPDLMAQLVPAVRGDVQEKIDALRDLGPAYLERCVEWIVHGRQGRQFPPPPAGLDPSMAKSIRESVLEQSTVARMGRA